MSSTLLQTKKSWTGSLLAIFVCALACVDVACGGDLVVLHTLSVDPSFRRPPAFQAERNPWPVPPWRGVSSTDPNEFIADVPTPPPGFAQSGDLTLLGKGETILDFEIGTGVCGEMTVYSASFTVLGDMNPLVSEKNLSRLAPEGVFLRFFARGDPVFWGWEWSSQVTLFDARFTGRTGFGSGEIDAYPSFWGAPVITDIPLTKAPSKGDVLGQVTLDAGVHTSRSAANFKCDTFAALAVMPTASHRGAA